MADEAWFGSMGAFPFSSTDTYTDGILRRAFRGNQIYLDDAPEHANEAVRQGELDAISGSYEFDLSINSYILRQDFSDGIIDLFADETGVDTATSTNEVFSGVTDTYAPSSGTNMTLVSEDVTQSWFPFRAGLVILMEEEDTITINTDIKGYISGDGGSNYVELTLAKAFDLTLAKYVLIGVDDIVTRDNDMKWKITTHNTKDLFLHSVSLLWR